MTSAYTTRLFHRLDMLLAGVMGFGAVAGVIVLNNIKYRLAFGSLAAILFVYLIVQFLSSREIRPVNIDGRYLHGLTFVMIAIAVLLAPSQLGMLPIYYIILGLICVLLTIQIINNTGSERLLLLEIVLLSLFIRSTVLFEFPTVAGPDTVTTYIPISEHISAIGRIENPSWKPDGRTPFFPAGYLRYAIGDIILGLSVKRTLFYSLSLPQAVSVVFVYIMISKYFNKRTGLIAALFVTISAFHIRFAFRQISQSHTTTLFPVLLLVLLNRRPRFVFLSVILFTVILLGHHAVPWLLIAFLVLLYVVRQLAIPIFKIIDVKEDSSGLPETRVSWVSPVLLAGIFITKFYYTTDIHGEVINIGRIFQTIVFLLNPTAFKGARTTSTSPGREEGFMLILQSASAFIIVSVLVAYGTFLIIRDWKQLRPGKVGWLISSACLWLIASAVTLSGPRNLGAATRLGAAMVILLTPLIYAVILDIYSVNIRPVAIGLLSVLILTMAVAGVAHPASTVSDQTRTERIALSGAEITSLNFSSSYVPSQLQMHSRVAVFVHHDVDRIYGIRPVDPCSAKSYAREKLNNLSRSQRKSFRSQGNKRFICSEYMMFRNYWRTTPVVRESHVIYSSGTNRLGALVIRQRDGSRFTGPNLPARSLSKTDGQ